MARGGYRIGRQNETSAEYDLRMLIAHVVKAEKQLAELLGMAKDAGRTDENRAACQAKAEQVRANTIPYLQARVNEQAGRAAA